MKVNLTLFGSDGSTMVWQKPNKELKKLNLHAIVKYEAEGWWCGVVFPLPVWETWFLLRAPSVRKDIWRSSWQCFTKCGENGSRTIILNFGRIMIQNIKAGTDYQTCSAAQPPRHLQTWCSRVWEKMLVAQTASAAGPNQHLNVSVQAKRHSK